MKSSTVLVLFCLCFLKVAHGQNYIKYFDMGHKKFSSKNYKGAIIDYTRAIKLNPNGSGAYYERGLSNFNLSSYENAVSDFTKFLKIRPNNAEGYY
ncbi:tetratricopeptide (TPR) repeat protein [Pedobacter sp. UYEF25]